MAARTKAIPAAPNGTGSDSEDDLATASAGLDSSSTGVENKRKTGKTAKGKASGGKTATKRKAATKEPRQALKDRTNLPDGNEDENMEDAEEDNDAKRAPKRAKTTAKTKANRSKPGRPPKRAPSPEPLLTIPETQPQPEAAEDVEQSIEIPDETDTVTAVAPQQTQRLVPRPTPVFSAPLLPRPSARAGSVQPLYPPSRERSGSVGVNERRGGDPELRRQFNELNKRHENLKLRLESLQEVGRNQAETNFEKLKRASDQKAKDANDLIASLRKELAELRKSSNSASSETAGLRNQLTTLTSTNEKLTSERDTLKSQLSTSQNEIKALEAKLSTARQQLSASAKDAKDRETANPKSRNAGPDLATATLKEKEAHMVQNLYSDLTGLVILGVKRKEGEDEFDCLQTGPNGTLHFHLSVANDPSTPRPKATPSGTRYDEAEFAYEPLLDQNRDRDLLELLPDYLVEDICFPRAHAQKFYRKVVENITRSFVEDGEEEGEE